MSSLAPIRDAVREASVVSQDEYTVREAIQWFKDAAALLDTLGVLAEPESETVNKAFAKVVKRTLTDQNLPEGPLGQFISSVALMERMVEIASSVELEDE